MKPAFPALGLSALLACSFATAQVTITQQGAGNGAYAEQNGLVEVVTPQATIIQIGNNNHAGDPVAHIPGIFQRTPFEVTNARIYQQGDANTANIVQDGTRRPVTAIIEQVGTGNTAGITQTIQTDSYGTLYQNGTNNLATLAQEGVGDGRFSAVQNGSDNRLSAYQFGTTFGTPTVTQTGTGNSVTLDLERPVGATTTIEQVGSFNTVNSTALDGDSLVNTIQQNGNGNTALTYQTGLPFGPINNVNSSVIRQTGDNNFASVTQDGPNDARIKQKGNDNSATLAQTYVGPGDPNIGFIKQIGNGFTANFTQTGAGNNAGIYQH